MELQAYKNLGGHIRYHSEFKSLMHDENGITGVKLASGETLKSKAVILACGFESNERMRRELLGEEWRVQRFVALLTIWEMDCLQPVNLELSVMVDSLGVMQLPWTISMKDYGNLNISRQQ